MPIRSAAVGKQTAPQVVDITPRRLLAYPLARDLTCYSDWG